MRLYVRSLSVVVLIVAVLAGLAVAQPAPKPKTVQQLVAELGDAKTAAEAGKALAAKKAEALPVLRKAVESDGKPAVRAGAAALLGQWKDKDATLPLLGALASKDEGLRRACVLALRSIHGTTLHKGKLDQAAELDKAVKAWKSWYAQTKVTALLGGDAKASAEAEKWFLSQEKNFARVELTKAYDAQRAEARRVRIVQVVAQLGTPEATAQLGAWMDSSKSAKVVEAAARPLGAAGAARAAKRYSRVRIDVLRTTLLRLALSDAKAAASVLPKALKETNGERFRMAFAQAEKNAGLLTRALDNKTPAHRLAVVAALRKLGALSAINGLVATAKGDSQSDVRLAAIGALGALSKNEAIQAGQLNALRNGLASVLHGKAAQAERLAALEALCAAGTAEVADDLMSEKRGKFEAKPAELRKAITGKLADLKDKTLAEWLAARTGDKACKTVAYAGLVAIADKSDAARAHLVGLVTGDDDALGNKARAWVAKNLPAGGDSALRAALDGSLGPKAVARGLAALGAYGVVDDGERFVKALENADAGVKKAAEGALKAVYDGEQKAMPKDAAGWQAWWAGVVKRKALRSTLTGKIADFGALAGDDARERAVTFFRAADAAVLTEALGNALASKDSGLRTSAAKVCAALPERAPVAELLARMTADKEIETVKLAVVDALASVAAIADAEQAKALVGPLGAAYDKGKISMRERALEGLNNLKDPLPAVKTLTQALAKDPEASVRRLAADYLGDKGVGAAVEALTTAMAKDDDESVRATAAGSLGDIGTPPAIDALLARQKAKDVAPAVQAAILGGLEQARDARAVPAYLDALSADDVDVRKAALRCLRAFAYTDIEDASDRGYDPEADASRRADGVESWREWWKLDRARKDLVGDDARKAEAARDVLAAAGEEVVAGLEETLDGDHGKKARVRTLIAQVLPEVGGQRATWLLVDLLADADKSVREAALAGLTSLGDRGTAWALVARYEAAKKAKASMAEQLALLEAVVAAGGFADQAKTLLAIAGDKEKAAADRLRALTIYAAGAPTAPEEALGEAPTKPTDPGLAATDDEKAKHDLKVSKYESDLRDFNERKAEWDAHEGAIAALMGYVTKELPGSAAIAADGVARISDGAKLAEAATAEKADAAVVVAALDGLTARERFGHLETLGGLLSSETAAVQAAALRHVAAALGHWRHRKDAEAALTAAKMDAKALLALAGKQDADAAVRAAAAHAALAAAASADALAAVAGLLRTGDAASRDAAAAALRAATGASHGFDGSASAAAQDKAAKAWDADIARRKAVSDAIAALDAAAPTAPETALPKEAPKAGTPERKAYDELKKAWDEHATKKAAFDKALADAHRTLADAGSLALKPLLAMYERTDSARALTAIGAVATSADAETLLASIRRSAGSRRAGLLKVYCKVAGADSARDLLSLGESLGPVDAISVLGARIRLATATRRPALLDELAAALTDVDAEAGDVTRRALEVAGTLQADDLARLSGALLRCATQTRDLALRKKALMLYAAVADYRDIDKMLGWLRSDDKGVSTAARLVLVGLGDKTDQKLLQTADAATVGAYFARPFARAVFDRLKRDLAKAQAEAKTQTAAAKFEEKKPEVPAKPADLAEGAGSDAKKQHAEALKKHEAGVAALKAWQAKRDAADAAAAAAKKATARAARIVSALKRLTGQEKDWKVGADWQPSSHAGLRVRALLDHVRHDLTLGDANARQRAAATLARLLDADPARQPAALELALLRETLVVPTVGGWLESATEEDSGLSPVFVARVIAVASEAGEAGWRAHYVALAERDGAVGAQACRALRDSAGGEAAALADLLGKVTDNRARHYLLQALNWLPEAARESEAAAESLSKSMPDVLEGAEKAGATRREALLTVQHYAVASAAEQVAEVLEEADGTDIDLLVVAARALGELKPAKGGLSDPLRRGVTKLIDQLDGLGEDVRSSAVESLRKLTGKEFGYDPADEGTRRVKMQAWKDWWTKHEAGRKVDEALASESDAKKVARTLAEAGERTLEVVKERVRAGQPTTLEAADRLLLVKAIGHWEGASEGEGKEITRLTFELLEDEDDAVREAAFQAMLARTGSWITPRPAFDASATEGFIRNAGLVRLAWAIEESARAQRKRDRSTIRSLTLSLNTVISQYAELADDDKTASVDVRLAMARLLRHVKSRDAVELLVGMLDDRAQAVRAAAIDSLKTLTGETHGYHPGKPDAGAGSGSGSGSGSADGAGSGSGSGDGSGSGSGSGDGTGAGSGSADEDGEDDGAEADPAKQRAAAIARWKAWLASKKPDEDLGLLDASDREVSEDVAALRALGAKHFEALAARVTGGARLPSDADLKGLQDGSSKVRVETLAAIREKAGDYPIDYDPEAPLAERVEALAKLRGALVTDRKRESRLRVQAARAIGQMLDDRAIDVLIRGLEDADEAVRTECFIWLNRITSQHFDYDPKAKGPAVRKSLDAWEDWRKGEGKLFLAIKAKRLRDSDKSFAAAREILKTGKVPTSLKDEAWKALRKQLEDSKADQWSRFAAHVLYRQAVGPFYGEMAPEYRWQSDDVNLLKDDVQGLVEAWKAELAYRERLVALTKELTADVAPLAQLAKAKDAGARRLAARMAARIETKAAAELLLGLLSDEDAAVRAEANEALQYLHAGDDSIEFDAEGDEAARKEAIAAWKERVDAFDKRTENVPAGLAPRMAHQKLVVQLAGEAKVDDDSADATLIARVLGTAGDGSGSGSGSGDGSGSEEAAGSGSGSGDGSGSADKGAGSGSGSGDGSGSGSGDGSGSADKGAGSGSGSGSAGAGSGSGSK